MRTHTIKKQLWDIQKCFTKLYVYRICNVYKLALHTDTTHTPIRAHLPLLLPGVVHAPRLKSRRGSFRFGTGAGLISPWLVRVGGGRHPSVFCFFKRRPHGRRINFRRFHAHCTYKGLVNPLEKKNNELTNGQRSGWVSLSFIKKIIFEPSFF